MNSFQFGYQTINDLKRIMTSIRQILLEPQSAEKDLTTDVGEISSEVCSSVSSVFNAIETSTTITIDGFASFVAALHTDTSMGEVNKELKTVIINEVIHCTFLFALPRHHY